MTGSYTGRLYGLLIGRGSGTSTSIVYLDAVQRTRITGCQLAELCAAPHAALAGSGLAGSRRPVIGQPGLIVDLAIARPTIAWQCGLAVQLANRPHIRQLVVYPHEDIGTLASIASKNPLI